MHDIPLWSSSDFAAPLPRGPGDNASLTDHVFDIDVEARADQPIVAHVIGAIDLLTARALRMCVDDHLDAGQGMVVDLSRVDFLAAAGLTVLTDTDRRAKLDNRAWAIVANTRPVLRPLEVLGLVDKLPRYDSVPAAVAALRTGAVTS